MSNIKRQIDVNTRAASATKRLGYNRRRSGPQQPPDSFGSEGTLQVPGASLYYKVRGIGPVLLILQGGACDADGSQGLVQHLVDAYTVVTYDRRGLSRSKLNDASQAPGIMTHSDDAHRLLAALHLLVHDHAGSPVQHHPVELLRGW